jgi:hypothetical protein
VNPSPWAWLTETLTAIWSVENEMHVLLKKIRDNFREKDNIYNAGRGTLKFFMLLSRFITEILIITFNIQSQTNINQMISNENEYSKTFQKKTK